MGRNWGLGISGVWEFGEGVEEQPSRIRAWVRSGMCDGGLLGGLQGCGGFNGGSCQPSLASFLRRT